MTMDERKRIILQAIIDDYIDSAEPVGSRTIARKHELGLSSATIRNEMADLEEMGYLEQLHTSSGRIPSDKGYRYYVDRLMHIHDLNKDEIRELESEMKVHISELGQLIRQVSAVLSRFTRYTAMAMDPHIKDSTIKSVRVVPIEKGAVLVIVVTDAGIVQNSLVKMLVNVRPDVLYRISNILSNKMDGLDSGKITAGFVKEMEMECKVAEKILKPVLEGVADCLNQIDNPQVHIEGTTNIFHHPEFRNMVRVKEFINMLNEKEILGRMLHETEESEGIRIRIGSENAMPGTRECSLITASYSLADVFIGTIGIIGPTRMEYPRVISYMRSVRRLMDNELYKYFG